MTQVDVATFRHVAGHWASGVAVITTRDAAGRLFGLTMSGVTSLSISPMQFLICVDNRSTSLPAILESEHFCINYLAAEQEQVSRTFAGKSEDKFATVPYRLLPSGTPAIDGALALIDCRIASSMPGGDHTIIVGDVLHAEASEREPLVHYRGRYRGLA
ncbi:flavin reductase family protein [Roseomonas sp. BN140053]|uniref:flavin reductase family protein n=1 Tax=Roseomonas sp. BN140053 TaxID=3391898 RepID=UPI0039EB2372